jgi:Cu(I)/Ag(I) efflux system membrane fusion protein
MSRLLWPRGPLAALILSGTGWGLYQVGMRHGDLASSASASASAPGQGAAAGAARVDPSNWGVVQGEAATRRHVETGLKAGDVDPLTGRQVLYYHDPMVPGKQFSAPGKSPFMDMMLVPAYAGAAGADPGTVSVSPRIQQNLGLRTGEVSEVAVASELVAVGAIAWNERDQAVLQARALGYVEKLHVRAALDRVSPGQPILDLYVPDWVAAQEDYLSVRRMQGSDLAPLRDAARQRMRQVGMSEAQISMVERSGRVQARMTLVAPTGGVVTELAVREGSTVTPGMLLARINGLSSVWAEAQVPESQLAQLRVGAAVVARSPAWPGLEFGGQVQAVLPEVDTTTRTLKVRMVLTNPGGQLLPGMFVQMGLGGPAPQQALWVPTEALIRTGSRVLVMTRQDDGAFRPVEVQTGAEAGDKTVILRGLDKGQQVVLSGQFLIDSEASLKGVLARSEPALPAASGPSGSAQMHRTRATVEAVNAAALTLTHPAIASLQWPAMTMDFALRPPLKAPRNSLPRVGQQIDVEFRMGDDGPVIEHWRAASGAGAAP